MFFKKMLLLWRLRAVEVLHDPEVCAAHLVVCGRVAPRNVGVVLIALKVSRANASRDDALEVERVVHEEDAGWCRHRAFRGRRRAHARAVFGSGLL